MVKIALQLKAFLENVTGLLADGEDFRYDNNSLSQKCFAHISHIEDGI